MQKTRFIIYAGKTTLCDMMVDHMPPQTVGNWIEFSMKNLVDGVKITKECSQEIIAVSTKPHGLYPTVKCWVDPVGL